MALDALEAELAEKEADVTALRRVVEQLRGRVLGASPGVQATSQEYSDLGMTEAVRRFLKEAGEPKTTRDICDTLLDRGIRTRSKNIIASVYATLTNNTKDFERKDGTWHLKAWTKRPDVTVVTEDGNSPSLHEETRAC